MHTISSIRFAELAAQIEVKESKWDKANKIMVTIPNEGRFFAHIDSKEDPQLERERRWRNQNYIGDNIKELTHYNVTLKKVNLEHKTKLTEAFLDKFGLVISNK
jgi:hypothetical protein